MFSLRFLLLFFIYLNLSQTTNTNLSSSELKNDLFQNGIITSDIGKLVLFNSHYFFPLRLFYADVVGHYDDLHTQFLELYTLIDSQERSNMTNSVIDILTEELRQYKHHYFDSLDVVKNMFKWSVNDSTNSNLIRNKRGLINGGGLILKYLLGTAQDSELQDINTSVNNLLRNSKTHDLQINVHNRILKLNTVKIHRIDEVQKNIVNLVNDLAEKFDSFDNFTQIIEQNMFNSNAFSSLILALMSLNSQTLIIKSGIEEMMSGRLSPGIVDTKTLRYYLSIIKNEGHSLLLNEENTNLSFYYDIAQVNAMYDADTASILFLISFPINFIETKPFSLIQVTSLPIKSSYSQIFSKYKVKKYIAMNEDEHFF